MVTTRRRGMQGASTLGCLVSLLIFVGALYYGVNIGEVLLRYYQLQDEMQSQARLAPSLNDATIRRRLLIKVDELDLPLEATHFKIVRTDRPRQIVIETEYSETVNLPLVTHTFHFKLHADEPL